MGDAADWHRPFPRDPSAAKLKRVKGSVLTPAKSPASLRRPAGKKNKELGRNRTVDLTQVRGAKILAKKKPISPKRASYPEVFPSEE